MSWDGIGADGSAYFESEVVKVMCAVYGPRATNKPEFSERASLHCDVKWAPFARGGGSSRKGGHQTDEEAYISNLCTKSLEACLFLEKYPKAQIDVYVLVLEADGPILGCALTVASLALADAGIEMRDLIASCTVGVFSEELLLDPDERDVVRTVQNQGALVSVAYLPNVNSVIQCHLTYGVLSVAQTQQAVELAIDACQKMAPVLRQALLQQSEGLDKKK